ncbi:hypothetical protein M0805_008058 [Coniferiporia weirii]|nr:hypothetical protein M0805_008058 [Coniferiporia weirii]
MPFNVASIKEKAVSAKNTTTTKLQNTRDRYSSTPMSKTRFAEAGYVPDARAAPPPPPPPMRSYGSHASRTSTSSRASEEEYQSTPSRPPPPVVRGTRPSSSASPSPTPPSVPRRAPWQPPNRKPETTADIETIDWAHLSQEDKQEFFNWLDEFFARYLSVGGTRGSGTKTVSEAATRGTGKVVEVVERTKSPAAPPISTSVVTTASPPAVRSWSKPKLEPKPSEASDSVDFEMAYPPPTEHGCQALDLAYYFHPSTYWDTAWYADPSALPPPMLGKQHGQYKGMYVTHNDICTVRRAVLFGDLSACWFSLTYSTSNQSHPARIKERKAWYVLPPGPMGGDVLADASATYGETIASFAESFLGTGSFCARGECWDLAAESLKCFSEYDYVDAPVPSLNRTHGHLIFEGKALGGGRQVGRWRGGDDRVRRGDFVEWRSVRIGIAGGAPGAIGILGDPDHTAVITRDAVPEGGALYDGGSLLPRALRELEVVEQSRNFQPTEPKRQTYDMERFEEGEVWIYRPVPMKEYIGFEEIECEPPSWATPL